jgi:ribosomal protein S18 acetylase RimI-like enzyme
MSTDLARTFRMDSIAGHMIPSDPATAIRPHDPADEAFERLLFHDSRAPQFGPLGLSDQMLATLLDQQFRAQRFGYAQSFPDAEHLIIAHGGAAVGRLIVALATSTAVCDQTSTATAAGAHTADRVVHLVDIAILSAARGCGIGTDVLQCLGRAAQAIGARSIALSVLQSNDRARRLYERLGFSAIAGGSHIHMTKPLG